MPSFDQGGVARGRGYMHKDVIAPERTLSPQQTAAFEAAFDRGCTASGPIVLSVHDSDGVLLGTMHATVDERLTDRDRGKKLAVHAGRGRNGH